MQDSRFRKAIEKIDNLNGQDPTLVLYEGQEYPKEQLYALRMSQTLNDFKSNPSEALQLAVRAQHIHRWKISRSDFPLGRKGYLRWRNTMKSLHAKLTGEILKDVGYDKEFISQVQSLIEKKNLKTNPDAQTLEDVACLVFLKYYLVDFSKSQSSEKIEEILQKTWRKMSEKAKNEAMKLKPGKINLKNILEK